MKGLNDLEKKEIMIREKKIKELEKEIKFIKENRLGSVSAIKGYLFEEYENLIHDDIKGIILRGFIGLDEMEEEEIIQDYLDLVKEVAG